MMRPVIIAALLGLAFHAVADEYEGVTTSGYIQHFAVKESSGLVASRRYPGVLWTHNDGGFQFLFAMDKRGKSIGAFQVPGKLVDWEDLGIDDLGNLYLADTGADGMFRTHVAVHRVKEPNPYKRFGTAQINRSWYLRFPEGPIQDCEAFFVRGNFGYLISRRATFGGVNMYRFSLMDTRRSVPLQFITKIPMDSPVTGASLSVDNQRLGLTTSDGVYVLLIEGRPASAGYAPQVFLEHHDFFMEGGTFFKDGFLTSAELSGQILWWTSSAFRCRDPVRIVTPPQDRTVGVAAGVSFEVIATGCPVAEFAWSFNGVPIPGATNAFLILPYVSTADAGVYQVVAFNRYGADTNSATLTVRTKPDIRITEVSSSQSPDALAPTVTADWFELTNFEPFPMDISGWRFNDSIGFLADPFVIPTLPLLLAGESIIFVENLSRDEFIAWWGQTNLQSDLKIVTYVGSGLSFRATGDTLFLWDNVSTDPADIVTRADFGVADPGVTFIYNPDTDKFGTTSQFGRYGAVRAANSPDVGSPGKTGDRTPGL